MNDSSLIKLVFYLLVAYPLCVSAQSLTLNSSMTEEPISFRCKNLPLKSHKIAKDPDFFIEKLNIFVDEMVDKYHFNSQNTDCLKHNIHYNSKVLHLVKPFPKGTPKNWKVYRTRFIEPKRIKSGALFWNTYQHALQRAEQMYGVPPEIIVGIIGVETIYGQHKGDFSVVNTLASLAFDYPEHPKRQDRLALFRNELEQVLLYSSENNIDPLTLKGSFAGAIGWPQFLPSSIRKYAVDFDEDGRIDLHNSPIDAIGSVANYLAQHGWNKDIPTIFSAFLKDECAFSESTLDNQLTANLKRDALDAACIQTTEMIPEDLPIGLIDLQNGFEATEYRLGTTNFFAIAHYNRSYFYAMAVIDLGLAVKYYRLNQENIQ